MKEDYENKNTSCNKKAKKNQQKCEVIEAALKLQKTSLTGAKLHLTKEDDGDDVVRRDKVGEGGSVVSVGLMSGEEDSGGGGEIEVIKTKKSNCRKLCKKKDVEKNSGADDVNGALIDNSIDGHTKRKEMMFGSMETFLTN